MKIQDNNRVPQLMKDLKVLQKAEIEVGIFGEDDSFMLMIARVHEFGAEIEPKNAKFLTIPLPAAGDKKASDFGDELFRPPGTMILAVPKGDDDFEPMFALTKKVEIPERSFIRSTFDEKQAEWEEFIQKRIVKVLNGKMSPRRMLEQFGAQMAADIQEKITDLDDPDNTELTKERKGSSNPLIGESGRLRQSVTWKVVGI